METMEVHEIYENTDDNKISATFENIANALSNGYRLYDRLTDGAILVRLQTEDGWKTGLIRPAGI